MSHAICSKVSKERSLRRAIRRLVRAEVDASWAGVKHPSERYDIEVEVQRANKALTRAIERAMT